MPCDHVREIILYFPPSVSIAIIYLTITRDENKKTLLPKVRSNIFGSKAIFVLSQKTLLLCVPWSLRVCPYRPRFITFWRLLYQVFLSKYMTYITIYKVFLTIFNTTLWPSGHGCFIGILYFWVCFVFWILDFLSRACLVLAMPA